MRYPIVPVWLTHAQERVWNPNDIATVKQKGVNAAGFTNCLVIIPLVIVTHEVTQSTGTQPANALHFPPCHSQQDVGVNNDGRNVLFSRPGKHGMNRNE